MLLAYFFFLYLWNKFGWDIEQSFNKFIDQHMTDMEMSARLFSGNICEYLDD